MPTSSIYHDFSIKNKADAKKFVKALDLAMEAKNSTPTSSPKCSFKVIKGDEARQLLRQKLNPTF